MSVNVILTRAATIVLLLPKRLLHISLLTHLLRQPLGSCRAVGAAFHRRRFGPLRDGPRSFTPSPARRGRLKLDMLPLFPARNQFDDTNANPQEYKRYSSNFLLDLCAHLAPRRYLAAVRNDRYSWLVYC